MEVLKSEGCFVCGLDNPSGLKARFTTDRENNRSSCRLILDARFQGWADVVHGGVISALLDEACIYAGLGLGRQLVTAELSVRFRKPLPVDREVLVSGEVLEIRRKVLRVKAWLSLDDEVHAEAESRVFVLD
ncbi:MAG: PaaI family thioesterase [Syntrophotaleaceae bacterium]